MPLNNRECERRSLKRTRQWHSKRMTKEGLHSVSRRQRAPESKSSTSMPQNSRAWCTLMSRIHVCVQHAETMAPRAGRDMCEQPGYTKLLGCFEAYSSTICDSGALLVFS